MDEDGCLIELRGVKKQFEGKRQVVALQGIDLRIRKGEMISIIGPSGSGKSTLLNIMGVLDRANTPADFPCGSNALPVAARPAAADEYLLYVVQLERHWKEWLIVGGYAGEAVTRRGGSVEFAAGRGLARAALGRASLTIDASRSPIFEGLARQDGHGIYAKVEFAQTFGGHWRASVLFAGIRGRATDFVGQFSASTVQLLRTRARITSHFWGARGAGLRPATTAFSRRLLECRLESRHGSLPERPLHVPKT